MYNYLKQKLFLNRHKNKEENELTEADLIRMFREEVANEMDVNLEEKREEK